MSPPSRLASRKVLHLGRQQIGAGLISMTFQFWGESDPTYGTSLGMR